MRLTEDLIKLSIDSGEKCYLYQDEYVLLNKDLPCKDSEFDDYIKRINMAIRGGINTPIIYDYYIVPGTDNQGVSKAVILEEKAPGNVLNIRGTFLNLDVDYEFQGIAKLFLDKFNIYLDEVEKRSKADIEVYEKLILDFINLKKYGLVSDANSLNFLFDEKEGFTVIDPYFDKCALIKDEDIFKYIINIVYGVARPLIYVKKDGLNVFYDLPFEYKKRLDEISSLINEKIISAFRDLDYSEEYIMSSFNDNKHRFKTTDSVMSNEEFILELSNWYNSFKNSKDIKI